MSRLTKHDKRYKCGYQLSTYYNSVEESMMSKLGKLEDLEEELGCPLEIVLKIMLRKIDEIIVNYGDGGYGSIYTDCCVAIVEGLYNDASYLSKSSNWVIETNICPVPLKDYKNTWFLKEDLSE